MRSVLEAAKLQGIFEFGGFRLDLNGPLLTRNGRALEVAPKALDILAVLAANAGRVVLKDDLLSLVWPDSVVEEGNLAVYISSLRKVLAENGEPGVWIETAPKRGYRFAAPVRRVPDIPGVVSSNGSEGLFRIAEHYMLQCTPEGCRRANDIFQGLIGKDPFDARARAGKAGSLLLRYFLGDLSVEQDRDAAAALLAEAGRIHPGCSHVRANLAHMNWFWNWQWQKAEDELQGAVELATDDMTRDYALMWHGSYLRGREISIEASRSCSRPTPSGLCLRRSGVCCRTPTFSHATSRKAPPSVRRRFSYIRTAGICTKRCPMP